MLGGRSTTASYPRWGNAMRGADLTSRSVRAAKLLRGYRGGSPLDADAVVGALLALDRLGAPAAASFDSEIATASA
jgi:hypothetical protein